VLRRIFGPNREQVVGGCRRLHDEELRNLYVSPNIIWVIKSRRMRWAGLVAYMEEMRNAYNILVRKAEGKKLCGRPRSRLEDNIRMVLRR
jgi:hypothetical protein